MALTRKKAVAMIKKIPVMTWDATKAIVLFLWEIVKNPLVLKDKLAVAQHHLKEVRLVLRADGVPRPQDGKYHAWFPTPKSPSLIACRVLKHASRPNSFQWGLCTRVHSSFLPIGRLAFGPQFGRHYWLGLKLLWGDIKTAKKIIKRILRGFPMTRRERKQLLRTASDIFRMVPLAVSLVQV